MGKKQKHAALDSTAAGNHAPEEGTKPDKPKRPGPKKRLRQLEARVEALERRLEDLGRVVDEAIRTSISARPKAAEVRPRRRKAAGEDAGAPGAGQAS